MTASTKKPAPRRKRSGGRISARHQAALFRLVGYFDAWAIYRQRHGKQIRALLQARAALSEFGWDDPDGVISSALSREEPRR